MFYNQLIKLCDARNLKPSPVLRSLGISATNLKKWQEGATVNSSILQKLAEYFDVPIDYFFENDEAPVEDEAFFYQRFIKLCNDNNIKPTPLLKQLNLSPNNLKRWQEGTTANAETLNKLCDYFGVIPDYFINKRECDIDDNANSKSKVRHVALSHSDRLKSLRVAKFSEVCILLI